MSTYVQPLNHASVIPSMLTRGSESRADLSFTYSISPITGARGVLPEEGMYTRVCVDDTQGFIKYPSMFPDLKGRDLISVVCNASKIGGLPGIGAAIFNYCGDAEAIQTKINNPLALNSFPIAIATWKNSSCIKKDLGEVSKKFNTKLKSFCLVNPRVRVVEPSDSNIVLLAIKNAKVKPVPYLIDKGITISETSACSKKIPDYLYEYLNVDRKTESFLRVSWNNTTSDADIETFFKHLRGTL